MTNRFKALCKLFLRLGISGGLLIWLFSKTDPNQLIEAFLDISPSAWILAFCMYLLSQLVSSLRWFCLARGLGFNGGLVTYIGYYFVGMYFNLFLPTSIGGDVLKVLFLSRGEAKRLRASYSVIMDRLLGLAAMFCLGATAMILYNDLLPNRFKLILFTSASVSLVAPIVLPWGYRLINSIWPEIGKRFSPLLDLWKTPKVLLAGFLLSVLLQALGMGAVALLASSMDLLPRPAFYFAAFPLVAVLTLLPVSFNGIGIREGGFVYFMGIKGVPAEKALTLSLSFFAVQVLASLIGGLAYIIGFHRRQISSG